MADQGCFPQEGPLIANLEGELARVRYGVGMVGRDIQTASSKAEASKKIPVCVLKTR